MPSFRTNNEPQCLSNILAVFDTVRPEKGASHGKLTAIRDGHFP